MEGDIDPKGGTVQEGSHEYDAKTAVMTEVHKRVVALEDMLETRRQAATVVVNCEFDKKMSTILAKLLIKALEDKRMMVTESGEFP